MLDVFSVFHHVSLQQLQSKDKPAVFLNTPLVCLFFRHASLYACLCQTRKFSGLIIFKCSASPSLARLAAHLFEKGSRTKAEPPYFSTICYFWIINARFCYRRRNFIWCSTSYSRTTRHDGFRSLPRTQSPRYTLISLTTNDSPFSVSMPTGN